MSLVRTNSKYSIHTSALMLALLVAVILQLCMVETAFAKSSEPTAVMSEMHDCCDDGPLSQVDVDSLCLECDSGALTVHHALSAPEPDFMLQYVTALLPLSSNAVDDWQLWTEPEIISRLPDIYLVQGVFLE